MKPLKLHIVCFTIPFPVVYGGVFDLYCKLEALKNIGIEIYLHCVQYGNNHPQTKLNQFCHSVYYYKRKKIFPLPIFGKPYIVRSRIITDLINRLNENDDPILIEGIHGTGIIEYLKNKNRKLTIRIPNVESIYYKHLAYATQNVFKKVYYSLESYSLKKWEQKLVDQNLSFNTLSILDFNLYKEIFHCKRISYIPLFIPHWGVSFDLEKRDYCLYHGNMDVEENQLAVEWLASKVFSSLDITFCVAGKSKNNFFNTLKQKYPNIQCIANPTDIEMQNLIHDAQIHILPSFNATGIKIKLINSLFNGRFCLVNNATIKDTGLDNLCIVANTAIEFQENIKELMHKTFDKKTLEYRKVVLDSIYDNNKNAILLKQLLYEE